MKSGPGVEWKREDTGMEDDRSRTTLHQMETASLVCGVLSIVFYFLSLGFVSMILGIVAIVLGNRCRRQGGSVTGFVCGIIGTSLGVLMVLEALMIIIGLRPFIDSLFDLFLHTHHSMRLV